MGINQSFQDIEKKYGQRGIDYIASKYQDRRIYSKIGDEIKRLNDQANLQQNSDLEFLSQQKRQLEQALQQGKTQIETKKPGALNESEAKHKMKVQQFSGYNDKKTWIQNLEKQIRNKYSTQRVKMQQKVRDQVNKHKTGGSSKIQRIPEYDNHPDNYRRTVENECAKKYPQKVKEIDGTDLGRKLAWENYKQNFVTILSRDQVKREVQNACIKIKKDITGTTGGICC